MSDLLSRLNKKYEPATPSSAFNATIRYGKIDPSYSRVGLPKAVFNGDNEALKTVFPLGNWVPEPGEYCAFIGDGNNYMALSLRNSTPITTPSNYALSGTTILGDMEFSDAKLHLDTQYQPLETSEGDIYWDSDAKTMAIVGAGEGQSKVVLQVGQELWTPVYNGTGSIIHNGTVISAGPTQGMLTSAILCDPSDNTKANIIGIATMDIPIGEVGFVTTYGSVHMDTSSFHETDILYAGLTPGSLVDQENIPDFPNYRLEVARVIKVGQNGTVWVPLHHIDWTDGVTFQRLHVRSDLSVDGNTTIKKLVSGDEINNLTVENGQIKLNGTATQWDDLVFPLTTGKLGIINKPDFDYDNNAYLFPQNDPSEKIYLTGQMSHSWKTGSMIYPHIHWLQTAATAVGWKLDYKLYDNGTTPPAWTTISLNTQAYTYVSGSLAQISKSATGIDCSTITGTSAMFIGRLYRDDNTTTGDVAAWQFDIHYEKDSLGSNTEYIK